VQLSPAPENRLRAVSELLAERERITLSLEMALGQILKDLASVRHEGIRREQYVHQLEKRNAELLGLRKTHDAQHAVITQAVAHRDSALVAAATLKNLARDFEARLYLLALERDGALQTAAEKAQAAADGTEQLRAALLVIREVNESLRAWQMESVEAGHLPPGLMQMNSAIFSSKEATVAEELSNLRNAQGELMRCLRWLMLESRSASENAEKIKVGILETVHELEHIQDGLRGGRCQKISYEDTGYPVPNDVSSPFEKDEDYVPLASFTSVEGRTRYSSETLSLHDPFDPEAEHLPRLQTSNNHASPCYDAISALRERCASLRADVESFSSQLNERIDNLDERWKKSSLREIEKSSELRKLIDQTHCVLELTMPISDSRMSEMKWQTGFQPGVIRNASSDMSAYNICDSRPELLNNAERELNLPELERNRLLRALEQASTPCVNEETRLADSSLASPVSINPSQCPVQLQLKNELEAVRASGKPDAKEGDNTISCSPDTEIR
jgi:hypothetical protein